MVQPIRPAGPIGPAAPPPPAGKPRPVHSEGPAFSETLRGTLRPAPSSPPSGSDRLAEIQRFASQALGAEAWEARLVETYDMLSADEGLYEVETPKGTYQVIRSRLGALSIYASP